MALKSRGFTLLEMVSAVALLGLLLALSLGRHGSERKRASSEGLAHLMASELRAARAEAMAQSRPIAVCWPANGSPICQSFYRIEGQSKGHRVPGRDLSSEYPGAYIANGFWGNATIAPEPGRAWLDVAGWLPQDFTDFALIFGPDGRVTSNDLPRIDGNYQLLVVSALDATSESPPGQGLLETTPPYFHLKRVASPHAIVISPSGSITYQPGASGLQVEAHPFAMSLSPSPPPSMSSPSFVAPTVASVSLQAPARLDRVGTVVPGGTLGVEVKGVDPSGDDLFLEWKAIKTSGVGTDSGYFSEPGRYPMRWNPRSALWESSISWVPPQDGVVGDTFELQFTMSNSAGSVLSTGFSQLTGITIVEDSVIYTSGKEGLYKVHKNGTGQEQVIPDPNIGLMGGSVDVSPDGSKVLWVRPVPSNGSQVALMVSDAAGGGTQVLLTSSDTGMSPCWNETGTRIFYLQGGRVMTMNADGSERVQVLPAPPAPPHWTLAISPDGAYLATQVGFDLYIGKLDQSTDPPTIAYWTNLTSAHSPEGQLGNSNVYIAFQKNSPISNQPVLVTRANPRETYIWNVTDSGSGFTSTLAPLLLSSGQPLRDHMRLAFSPDGAQVVTVTGVPNSTATNLNLFDFDPVAGLRNRRIISCDFEPYYLDWR
jgi:prepilin-type N-terminal cleavage/methylation domain-containing protein